MMERIGVGGNTCRSLDFPANSVGIAERTAVSQSGGAGVRHASSLPPPRSVLSMWVRDRSPSPSLAPRGPHRPQLIVLLLLDWRADGRCEARHCGRMRYESNPRGRGPSAAPANRGSGSGWPVAGGRVVRWRASGSHLLASPSSTRSTAPKAKTSIRGSQCCACSG